MTLKRRILGKLTENSSDPSGNGKYINRNQNKGLSDSTLSQKISYRNSKGLPTYKLRKEYESRLNQRGF